MYKQMKLGRLALAAALAVATVGIATAGTSVGSGNKAANEVFGRAAGGAVGGAAVGSGPATAVSDISGRGSHMPGTATRPVDTSTIGVEHLGRGSASGTMAKARPAVGDTLAQSR